MKNQKLNKEKMIEKLLSLAFACTLLAPVFFSFNVIYKSYVGIICILYITDMNISGPILILQYTCPFITLCNVLGLCEGGELEVQMFNLAEMLIRIPMLKFSTNAPLLQNPC
jgi:hypothetical protein